MAPCEHALALHPQHVDDVGVGDRRDVVCRLGARPGGSSAGGPTSTASAPTSVSACTSDRATRECSDVTDDRDVQAVEAAERLAHGVQIEQRLRRVLMLPVAGVDDARIGDVGHELRGARLGVTEHDHVRVVGRERQRRVLQRLALVDRRAGRLERQRVGRQPLGGELERRARARRRLVEDVEDEAAAQRRQLLVLPLLRERERPRRREQAVDVVARRGRRSRADAVVRSAAAAGLRRQAQVGHASTSSRSADEQHAVDLVDLDAARPGRARRGRRQVLADVVGPDRQLAVAAVGEHGELHALGPAVLEEGVDRGADRAARVEDVVDEDDRASLELEVEPRVADERLRRGAAPCRRARGRRRGGR